MPRIIEDCDAGGLALAVERNLDEAYRSWAAWPGLELIEDERMSRTVADVDFNLFNNIFNLRFEAGEADEAVEAAAAAYRERNLPMRWRLGPGTRPPDLADRLEALGYARQFEFTGMAARIEAVTYSLLTPKGLAVSEVKTPQDLRTWSRIVCSTFEFPEPAHKPWLLMHNAMGYGLVRNWRHYVARLDSTPVGAVSLFFGAGVAGVFYVAVIPDARKRNIGAAVTLAPLFEARRQGFKYAVLCAWGGAERLYRKLSFEEVCPIIWFGPRR